MNDKDMALLLSTIADALNRASGAFTLAARDLGGKTADEVAVAGAVKGLDAAPTPFAQTAQQAPAQQATPPASAGPWQQQNTPPAAQPASAANPWQQATSGNITPIGQAAAQAPQFTEQDVMQRFQTISQRFGPDPITGEGGLLRTAGVQRVSELRADQYPEVIAHADAILAGQGGAA